MSNYEENSYFMALVALVSRSLIVTALPNKLESDWSRDILVNIVTRIWAQM
jgi:hypothetical protein